MSKPHRFDLFPNDFLADVAGRFDLEEFAVYWMVCLRIYQACGPIADDATELCAGFARKVNPRTIRAALERLEAKTKIERIGGEIHVNRCRKEIESSLNRMRIGAENGANGGRPRKEINDIAKPKGFSDENPTISINNSISNESPNGDSSPPIIPPKSGKPRANEPPSRGARIVPDWQPNDQDVAFAEERGIDPAPARDEFVDYWISQTGRNAVKADWSATWRNHIRRMAERRIGRNGGSRNGSGTGPLVIDQHGNVDQRSPENPRPRTGRSGPASVATALGQIDAARKTGGSGW